MAPTLLDRQLTVVAPPRRLRRGCVVVLVQMEPPWGKIIKRVAGMPDEEIVLEDGRVYADDVLLAELPSDAGRRIDRADVDGRREWWNGPDEYFVLGDNPAHSTDSRTFGPVSAERIIGRVWLRIWPPKAWGWVR